MTTTTLSPTAALAQARDQIARPTLASPGPNALMRQYRVRYPAASFGHHEYLGTFEQASRERQLRIAELASQLSGAPVDYIRLYDLRDKLGDGCSAKDLLSAALAG